MAIPNWLYKKLENNVAIQEFTARKSPITISSLIQEALLIATSYQQNPRPIIILKPNLYLAQQLYERLLSFLSNDECSLFASDESLRVEAIATSPELRAQQVDTLFSLQKNYKQVVVTCPAAYLRYLPLPNQFAKATIHL